MRRLEIASRAFDRFREQQTRLGGEITSENKAQLQRLLRALANELDGYLAREYGVDLKKSCRLRRMAKQPPALPLVCGVLRDYEQGRV